MEMRLVICPYVESNQNESRKCMHWNCTFLCQTVGLNEVFFHFNNRLPLALLEKKIDSKSGGRQTFISLMDVILDGVVQSWKRSLKFNMVCAEMTFSFLKGNGSLFNFPSNTTNFLLFRGSYSERRAQASHILMYYIVLTDLLVVK